jgi:hypothetical protein
MMKRTTAAPRLRKGNLLHTVGMDTGLPTRTLLAAHIEKKTPAVTVSTQAGANICHPALLRFKRDAGRKKS